MLSGQGKSGTIGEYLDELLMPGMTPELCGGAI
jgi:hypothetical protein